MNIPPEKTRKTPAGNSRGAGIRLAVRITALLLPFMAVAQDRATIVGGIADGTPAAPAPKPELPEVEVRETLVHELPGRKLTVNRVADPGLPSPRPAVPERKKWTPEQVEAFRNLPHVCEWIEKSGRTTHLFISATVVDGRATFLRWWHDGKEYQAWSNADWMILTGFADWEKGDRRYSSLLMAGRLNFAKLPADSMFRIPENLPVEPGAYRVIQGDGDAEAYHGITGLHEIYRNDHARLKQAYNLREQRRKQREAELRLNPPQPEDIVLNYWKVQPERKTGNAKGGAR